jgi:hypothetical protein
MLLFDGVLGPHPGGILLRKVAHKLRLLHDGERFVGARELEATRFPFVDVKNLHNVLKERKENLY